VWAALRDLVPEHVLEGLDGGARIEPHVQQAVVLEAHLEWAWSGDGGADGAGAEGPAEDAAEEGVATQLWLEAAAELHELLSRLDQEVCLCLCGCVYGRGGGRGGEGKGSPLRRHGTADTGSN
jgi:hypothetical protein